MARLARIVAPGKFHVTARGNRREPIVFEDGEKNIYCDMLAVQSLSECGPYVSAGSREAVVIVFPAP